MFVCVHVCVYEGVCIGWVCVWVCVCIFFYVRTCVCVVCVCECVSMGVHVSLPVGCRYIYLR